MSEGNLPHGLGKWGPGVLGQEEYDRQQRIIQTGAWKYGAALIDAPDAPAEPVTAVPEPAQRRRRRKAIEGRETSE